MENLKLEIITKYNQQIAEETEKINAKKEGEVMLAELGLHEKQTGVDAIVYGLGHVGFNWRTPYGNSDGIKVEDVAKIWKAIPISTDESDNHVVKFADSSKNITTDSPMFLKYKHDERVVKCCYTGQTASGQKVKVDIVLPMDWFKEYTHEQKCFTKKNFGHVDKRWTETEIQGFQTARYSGGYRTLYFLEGAEHVEEFENFCLTGDFKYLEELV